MPVDWTKYPKNWKEISMKIRKRSGGQCECAGECGLHNGMDFFYEQRRCIEINGTKAKFAKGKIVLTVAHLNHDTKDNRSRNLKAMCQRCHLRYDSELHKLNSKKTRQQKLIERDCFNEFLRKKK